MGRSTATHFGFVSSPAGYDGFSRKIHPKYPQQTEKVSNTIYQGAEKEQGVIMNLWNIGPLQDILDDFEDSERYEEKRGFRIQVIKGLFLKNVNKLSRIIRSYVPDPLRGLLALSPASSKSLL